MKEEIYNLMSDNGLYYNGPTQVKFLQDGAYYGAIAYHDILITGDAQVLKIKDVLAKADAPADVVIVEFDWVNLNDIILYGKASD